MDFSRGDVYVNTHSGTKCLIEWAKDDKVKILWSFKCKLGGSKNWPLAARYRVIHGNESVVDGPDAYVEYACIKPSKNIESEISGGYIKRIYKAKDNPIMFWIPQHSFVSL
jgi:hypothetical protein